MSVIYDDRPCELGEGPLWHPERKQLFWFDIVNKRLMTRANDEPQSWDFAEHVSAAGWVDRDTLFVASETGLWRFGLENGQKELISPVEADNPVTRSNDGRADPWGGFWIGTMGKVKRDGAGTIYRFYQGKVTPIVNAVTIPNAICFAPDRSCAYYSDTVSGTVMRQPLEPENGWPEGAPEVFLDLADEGLNPDGAVVDKAGNFWNAQWGAWRVACYSPEGKMIGKVSFDAAHTSCPAFGGPGLSTLFCTSARENVSDENAAKSDKHGMTFAFPETGHGQAEHRILL